MIAAIVGLAYSIRKLVIRYKKWSQKPSHDERDHGEPSAAEVRAVDDEQTAVDGQTTGTDRTPSDGPPGNDAAWSSSSVVVVDMENDDPRDVNTRLEKWENASTVR